MGFYYYPGNNFILFHVNEAISRLGSKKTLCSGAKTFVDNADQIKETLRLFDPQLQPSLYLKTLSQHVHKLQGSAALLSLSELYDACVKLQRLLNTKSSIDHELIEERDRLIRVVQDTANEVEQWLSFQFLD